MYAVSESEGDGDIAGPLKAFDVLTRKSYTSHLPEAGQKLALNTEGELLLFILGFVTLNVLQYMYRLAVGCPEQCA